MKIGYYNISDMNATDAIQFIEDYSSTTIDGYKSRQSLFNNIDIRRKIFGIKADKIKDAMERSEQVVKFNKLYWGNCFHMIILSYRTRFKTVLGNRYETARPDWTVIDSEDSHLYNIYGQDEKVVWKEYLELGHDDFISKYE